MLLADIARTSREITSVSSRTEKIALLAGLFRTAEPAEAPLVVTYLAGRLPQRRTGIGPRALSAVHPAPFDDGASRLTLAEVDGALERIAAVTGKGAQAGRAALLDELMSAATGDEQHFLRRLLSGELRQGALDAFAVEGLAQAVGAPADEVRRAVMFGGSLGAVAQALLDSGPAALAGFRLRTGRPVQPMLAQSAKDLPEALEKLGGPCVVEEKLDGIRVQVHIGAGTVRVFTRTLDEITARLPELAEAAAQLAASEAVLDGEVVALREDGTPRPFQEVSQRVGASVDVPAVRRALPVTPRFFDVLSAEGRDLTDLPLRERFETLRTVVPEGMRVRRLVVAGTDAVDAEAAGTDASGGEAVRGEAEPAGREERLAAQRFAHETVARGHEGVMVKSLGAPYSAGRRGASWLKVKPVHTLDLVVLAAEWGHGRRTGMLSNLHLGARQPESPAGEGRGERRGEVREEPYVMLGKTFKGLTDTLLAWQTEALSGIAVSEHSWGVRVRPELVVEVAVDGVQRSTRYPAGVTLRFARVIRYRPDKDASEADTVADVLALRR